MRTIFGTLLMLTASSLALADDELDAANRRMATGSFEAMPKKCEKKIKTTLDWPSFKAAFKETSKEQAAVYCAPAADAVYWLCDDEVGRAAAQAHLTSVQCRYDAGATQAALGRRGPRLTLDKGKLVVGYNWETTDTEDVTRDWLRGQLRAPGAKRSVLDTLAIAAAEKDAFSSHGVELARKLCGKKLTHEVDWDSFLPALKDNFNHARAAVYCAGVTEGVRAYCADDDKAQTRIQKQLDKIRCVYDEKSAFGLSLTGGVLEARFHWDSTDFQDKTEAWLEQP